MLSVLSNLITIITNGFIAFGTIWIADGIHKYKEAFINCNPDNKRRAIKELFAGIIQIIAAISINHLI